MITTAITHVTVTSDCCLGEGAWLDLAALARACAADPGYIEGLIAEGLLEPAGRFGSDELARVRRIQRLQADFEASLPAVALMLDLIDEVDRLRTHLHAAGLRG